VGQGCGHPHHAAALLHAVDHLAHPHHLGTGGAIMIGYRMEKRIMHWLVLVGVAVVLVVVLFPIYWMLLTGIKPKSELYLPEPTLWTSNPTLDNLNSLFNRTPFPIQFRNSLFVATTTTVISIVVSSLAGYSLSRLHYPGRDFFSSAIFFIYLIPGMMTLIPL